MVLFAKATILLNKLLLILFVVCLHKWKMKDGKYRSEKTVRDKNTRVARETWSVAKACTTHNHLALWQVRPWKSSQWTHWGARSLGSLYRELSLAVLQLDLEYLEEWVLLTAVFQRWMLGWTGGYKALQVPFTALQDQNRDQVAYVFLSPLLSCICFWGACCQLPFHVPQWASEGYKSLDHFSQVLILQHAASQEIIN